jgi:hypothetical protein
VAALTVENTLLFSAYFAEKTPLIMESLTEKEDKCYGSCTVDRNIEAESGGNCPNS